MSYLEFNTPPFPTLITEGYAVFEKGTKHFRRVFSVFDLIYVKTGELYLTEDEKSFTVTKGQYIILVPGFEHYGHKGSPVKTEYYWFHFLIPTDYDLVEKGLENWGDIHIVQGDHVKPPLYKLRIPCYGEIEHNHFVENIFENILGIDHQAPDYQLRQQLYFQEFLLHLQKEACKIPTAAEKVVELTVAYIQNHYKTEVKMEDISKNLHFHPDYITRCMQKITGITPNLYLNKFRMNQAKKLLATTNNKIANISKEVGIEDSTYFSKLFKRLEGMSPIEYRKVINRRQGRD
ncbi:AraC-like DNA-binding protein [Metabacillus crassostreae]|uniref:AraC family transcriptional regulator n=1 Tax=Metabacillus crassostreae TaxID=929098 RepID=UPI00195B5776|nr:AraC family transcriptional regulator [Metabacillus crassostreae]MBM7604123.1 AraC-like DNA-binding protein [Metabacillus crassostreae]